MTDSPDWIESHETSVVGMALLASAEEWINCLNKQKNGTFIRLFLPDRVKRIFNMTAEQTTANGGDATIFESTIFTLLILNGISKTVEEKGEILKNKIIGKILAGAKDERKSSDQDQSSDQEVDENPLSGS